MSFLKKLFGVAEPERKKPKILVHEAFGGAIRVFEVPTADGWELTEDARESDGFAVMVLKYSIPVDDQRLVLLAKIYTGAENAEPPLAPDKVDWSQALGPLFFSIDNVVTASVEQMTMKSKVSAVEAILDGQSSSGDWRLRIRERRAVVKNEEFIVGAIGPMAAFERHQKEIDSWFENAAFVPIDEDENAKT